MTDSSGIQKQARRAAWVNGLLVFAPPTALTALALAEHFSTDPAILPVRVSTADVLLESGLFELAVIGLSIVAAWRTLVHARHVLNGGSSGARGIREAAICGFVVAVLYLSGGIVTRPLEAPPYVIFYGGAAAILGAIVGLILFCAARLVLRLQRLPRPS